MKPSSIIREYRIPLPLSTEEFHIGQLFGVAEASKNETGGGEGIEIVENRPITEDELRSLPFKDQLKLDGDGVVIGGQYTHKRMYFATKVPYFVRVLAPSGSLELDERAWNCYPYCRTEYSNKYMGDHFHIVIESMHQDDDGSAENALNLAPEELKKRKVVHIDIANDPCEPGDYKPEEDPTIFSSTKTSRGPLTGLDWKTSSGGPVMCCYKVYRILFKWKLLQNKVENKLVVFARRLLFNISRQIFCWMDRWYGMTMDDIRQLEDKTQQDLTTMLKEGEVRGTVES